MKKLTRVIAIALSMMLVFFNEPFFIHAQNEASDFSQFITSASLAYQDAKGYTAYSEDAAITETTPLLFKVEADLPSSALSSDHTINYALPEGLNLDETTSTDVYLKGDETHSIGTYTIKQNKMVIDFSSLDYGQEQSKTIIVEIKTTPAHLTFVDSEAKIYFKKATDASSSEVMVSVLQSYQDTADEVVSTKTEDTTDTTKVKTAKRTVRKNSVKLASDGYKEISDKINNLVKAGLSGKYRLKSLTYVDASIGHTLSINSDVTIDLNGQKLQLYDGVHFDIGKKGHLTIEDSKASNISVTEKGTTDQTGNLSSLTTSTQGNNDNRYVPETLDYYVTKATPKNTTTEDQTIKYEADLSKAGRIYSEKKNPTFYIEKGGNLDFNSGVAYNPDYFVVETQNSSDSTQAVFNLSGGYLIGNRRASVLSNNTTSVLSNNTNNKITMSGGVITNGKASSGGGIYNNGGEIDLKGGIITGNEASGDAADQRYSGGGIYMSSGTLNISGNAYITNNNKSSGDSTGDHAGIHGGGGVAADNNTTVNMSGGYVTGNYSHEAGGGLYIGYYTPELGSAKLTLTGGIIASNVAETGEGGGIRIGGQGHATVKAISKNHPIYITNNKTNTGISANGTGDWGGGGIFIQTHGQMVMMNALITGNNADGFGAGVSACPTGQTKIVTDHGAAIYGNTAKGAHYSRGSNGKSEDQAAYNFYQSNNPKDYQDYFLAHSKETSSYQVTNAMLGGGSENYSGTFSNGVTYEQEYDDAKFIGLSANPSQYDKNSALNLASTYISGNYSHNHGAGIMTNGILTLGESNDIFPEFHLNAYKAYLLQSADQKSSSELAMKDGQFKFEIYKHTGEAKTVTWDGTKFSEGSGTNTLVAEFDNNAADVKSLGKISAEIPNIYYDEAGNYTFYLVEKDNGDQKISYDHSIYQIKFSVKASDTKTGDNVQTTTYSLQDIAVSKISNGKSVALNSRDYTYSQDDSLLTLYNKYKAAFSNTEQSYDFSLTKNDQNHPEKVLSGAEFTLYQLDDQDALTKLQTITTDNDGKAVFSSLRKGQSYYLKETKAPAHYETAGPWKIQVSENGELTFYEAECTENSDCTSLTKNSSQSFDKGEGTKPTNNVYSTTISDIPVKYTMPNTGGKGTQSYYQLGILLLSVVNVLWIIKRRVV